MPLDTPMVGTEDGQEFFRVLIKAEKDDMDVPWPSEDVVEAGKELVAPHPDVGAIVLECTNMPPYAAALQAEVGLPGLRHLFHDHLVSCGTAAASVWLEVEKPPMAHSNAHRALSHPSGRGSYTISRYLIAPDGQSFRA